jgi:hypothetical protein
MTADVAAELASPTWDVLCRVQREMYLLKDHLKPNLTPRVRKELRRHVRRLERIEDYLIGRINERDTP